LEAEKLKPTWNSQQKDLSNMGAKVSEEQEITNSKQTDRFFTPERLYTLGSRLVPLLFLVILLFVAALYYGAINP
jgi:hypothetical protein